MKIAELLSEQEPASAPVRVQNLSMHRIVQELQAAAHKTAVNSRSDSPAAPPLESAATPDDDDDVREQEEREPRRRRARNGCTPLTELEKRVKQRQLVKRSYYRKIDTINELREVAEQLENQFQTVLAGRRRVVAQRQLMLSPCEALREQYAALALASDDLRQENEALRAAAAEQAKVRTRVGILADEELRDQAEVARVLGCEPRPARYQEDDARFDTETAAAMDIAAPPMVRLAPISLAECLDIARKAYSRIMAFRDANNLVSTGASVFGWRDRRKVEGATMKFFLEKTFNRPAADVATTMWRVLSTEAGVNRIYRSAIAIQFHLIRRVDANNVVFYRTIEREGQGVTIKSLVLASLVQIENGYMLLFHSLEPAQRLLPPPPSPHSSPSFAPHKREVWADVFSWGLYEFAGEHQELCRNSFGGFVPSSSVTSLEFWLMHILLIVVRCETEVIGPVFALQSE